MRINILEILQQVSDGVKLEILLPVIKTYLATSYHEDYHPRLRHFILALKAFDSTTANDLNNEKSEVWSVMMKAWKDMYTKKCESSLLTFIFYLFYNTERSENWFIISGDAASCRLV